MRYSFKSIVVRIKVPSPPRKNISMKYKYKYKYTAPYEFFVEPLLHILIRLVSIMYFCVLLFLLNSNNFGEG